MKLDKLLKYYEAALVYNVATSPFRHVPTTPLLRLAQQELVLDKVPICSDAFHWCFLPTVPTRNFRVFQAVNRTNACCH